MRKIFIVAILWAAAFCSIQAQETTPAAQEAEWVRNVKSICGGNIPLGMAEGQARFSYSGNSLVHDTAYYASANKPLVVKFQTPAFGGFEINSTDNGWVVVYAQVVHDTETEFDYVVLVISTLMGHVLSVDLAIPETIQITH